MRQFGFISLVYLEKPEWKEKNKRNWLSCGFNKLEFHRHWGFSTKTKKEPLIEKEQIIEKDYNTSNLNAFTNWCWAISLNAVIKYHNHLISWLVRVISNNRQLTTVCRFVLFFLSFFRNEKFPHNRYWFVHSVFFSFSLEK